MRKMVQAGEEGNERLEGLAELSGLGTRVMSSPGQAFLLLSRMLFLFALGIILVQYLNGSYCSCGALIAALAQSG